MHTLLLGCEARAHATFKTPIGFWASYLPLLSQCNKQEKQKCNNILSRSIFQQFRG